MAKNTHAENLRAEDKTGGLAAALKSLLGGAEWINVTRFYSLGNDESWPGTFGLPEGRIIAIALNLDSQNY